MPMSPPAVTTSECDFSLLGSGDFLARHPIFQARDLESVRHYLSGVLAPHRLTYWTRERGIDFRHQIAKIGAVDLNTIRFGGDVMVAAPDVPDFYLLHFMLAGNGTLTQGGRSFDQPAGSVTVINSNRSFAKKVSSASRQLLIRIERSLLERELQAWIGREPKQLIEFDQSQAFAITKVATLTHAVRMLCDDLGDDSSSLDHPLVRDRVASALVAALLVGLPHNHSRAFEGAQSPISPASVRRAEQFIEEHATKAIGLADIACAAGVSARALANGVSPFSRYDADGAFACAATGHGAQRTHPSKARRRLGRLGCDCPRVRVSQPLRGRLQGPIPRAAFRNPSLQRLLAGHSPASMI